MAKPSFPQRCSLAGILILLSLSGCRGTLLTYHIKPDGETSLALADGGLTTDGRIKFGYNANKSSTNINLELDNRVNEKAVDRIATSVDTLLWTRLIGKAFDAVADIFRGLFPAGVKPLPPEPAP